MKNLFNSVKMTRPNSNVFDLSHDVKLSGVMGNLIPTCLMECVPGDKFKIGCESLVRFAPLVAPVMHRMDLYMHYFFVPSRILWDGWEKWIVSDPAAPAFPYLTITQGGLHYTKLADYLGVPNPAQNTPDVNEFINPMPFAAYQAIVNAFYRDQNLIPEIDYKLLNGNNETKAAVLTTLRKRAWEHDYFTSALPFAQKGSAVEIPLGDVELKQDWDIAETNPYFKDVDGTAHIGTPVNQALDGLVPEIRVNADGPAAYDPQGSLQVGTTTINELRKAFRLQEWLEKNARGGTRYIEHILAHFGVKSSDKRLQRPEYITGIKTPVVISEVLNTTGTENAPQGSMAGHAISVSTGKYGSYYCEEHGFIIGIMSVMPKTAYQQGLPRIFCKTTSPFDYYYPSFAHIGEQEVLKREIFAFKDGGTETFGYVPRYAEYKFMNSRVAGDFRTTQDYWHLGRIFANRPELNQAFIECVPDDRIFAVQDGSDYLWCHVLHKIQAVRRMPKFGTPSF